MTHQDTDPPGPDHGLWGLGNVLEFGHDQLQFLLDAAQTYGDIVHYHFGPYSTYFVNNPDYIREILVEHPEQYHKWSRLKTVFGKTTGNATVQSDGDFWKRQRKLVQPAFHTRRIEAYTQSIGDLTQHMLAGWQPNADYDIAQEMFEVTMGIISKVLFDVDLGEATEKISRLVTITQEMSNKEMRAVISIPEWIPTPSHLKEHRAITELHELIRGIIEERRASGEDRGDLLSMLLISIDDESGSCMTNEEAENEALTLFLAGHETTASLLSWTFYALWQNPEVETRLVEEIERVLGGRTATASDVRELKYTEMVLKESMRVNPPLWLFFREPIEDVTLGGYAVSKGSVIMISPYTLHRSPKYFDEPDRFLPERFAEDAAKPIPRYAFIPFGGGPRICTGQSFAMLEATIVLTTVLQRYHLALAPGHRVQPEPLIAQRPDDLVMTVTRRSAAVG